MDVRSTDIDVRVRRRRGLALGGVGIALLFAPAILLVLFPGPSALYAIVPMLAGVVFLIAGFVILPGSLANMLRPKP